MSLYGAAIYGPDIYTSEVFTPPPSLVLKPASIEVFVRDAHFNLIGQIEDFQQLTLTLMYNDVGTWEITLPAESPGAALLDRAKNPTGGIVVLRNGVQLISGPARGHKWSRSSDTGNGTMTIVGLDDAWILNSRLVWPDPSHTVDTQANVWWSTNASNLGISQPAETIMYNLVQAQMAAGVANGRGVPNLVFATNQGRGYSQRVPKTWRFNTVLDALQQMSVLSKNPSTGTRLDELGFDVNQLLGTPNMQFTVFKSNDRSGTVRFSFDLGNLAEAEYSTTAPAATTVVTGAGNTTDAGSNAQINASLYAFTRSDSYYPGFYSEGFLDSGEVDPTDVNAVTQLQQNVDSYWSSNAGQVSATFKAVDTGTMAFGTHYGLGDFVTVELPQLTLVERVRQIGLSYSPDSGEELGLAVGTADGVYGRLTPGHSGAAVLQRILAQIKAKQAAQARAAAAKKAHDAHVAHLAHQAHLKTLAAKKKRVQPAVKKKK